MSALFFGGLFRVLERIGYVYSELIERLRRTLLSSSGIHAGSFFLRSGCWRGSSIGICTSPASHSGACSASIAQARSSARASINSSISSISSFRKFATRFNRVNCTSRIAPLLHFTRYWINRRSRSSAVFGLTASPGVVPDRGRCLLAKSDGLYVTSEPTRPHGAPWLEYEALCFSSGKVATTAAGTWLLNTPTSEQVAEGICP